MTHRFDDDGGDEYDDLDGWEPGSHNNPSQMYDARRMFCPFCRGKGKLRNSIDYDKLTLEKCKACNGSGYQ